MKINEWKKLIPHWMTLYSYETLARSREVINIKLVVIIENMEVLKSFNVRTLKKELKLKQYLKTSQFEVYVDIRNPKSNFSVLMNRLGK